MVTDQSWKEDLSLPLAIPLKKGGAPLTDQQAGLQPWSPPSLEIANAPAYHYPNPDLKNPKDDNFNFVSEVFASRNSKQALVVTYSS